MPLHQRDFILRLIEQAGAAVARLRAMLGLGTSAEALSPQWLRIALHDRAAAFASRYEASPES